MSSLNKKLTAVLVAVAAMFCVVLVVTVRVLGSDYSEVPAATAVTTVPVADNAVVPTTVSDLLNQFNGEQNGNAQAAPTTAVGNGGSANLGAAGETLSQNAATTAPVNVNPSSMSNQQILDVLTAAVNKTKAYTGNLKVKHSESFEANVTDCTGGAPVAAIASRLIGLVVKPSDETLSFSGGKATNGDGEVVPLLLPDNGPFKLTMSGVKSISARSDGGNTIIEVALVPESVGMYDVPQANASGIGYLDVSSLDLSFLEVTKASIIYTGSQIKATIGSGGYVSHVEYKIPLHVEGSARISVMSGSAVFDGAETEIWDTGLN